MHKIERIEFYYSKDMDTSSEFSVDLDNVIKRLNDLSEKGVDVEIVDLSDIVETASVYHRALSGEHKPAFLNKNIPFEDWGRKFPLLLCYRHANDRVPFDVYPRYEGERIITIEEALEKIAGTK